MDSLSQHLVNGRERVNELAAVFGVFAVLACIGLVILFSLEEAWITLGGGDISALRMLKGSSDPFLFLFLFLVSTTVWFSTVLLYIWFPVFESAARDVRFHVENMLYRWLGLGFGFGLVLAAICHRGDILLSAMAVLCIAAAASAVLQVKTLESGLRESLVLRVLMSAGVLLMIGLAVSLTWNAVS